MHHIVPNWKLILSALFFTGALVVPSSSALGDSQVGAVQSRLLSARAAHQDSDHDGLPNIVEKALGTNPRRADSNGNGIWDGDEVDPKAGITRLEAYESESHGEDDGDNDDDDGDSDHKPVIRPPLSRPGTCGERITRNCKAPVCSRKRNNRKSKLCRPGSSKPVTSPTATPQPTATPRPGTTPRPTATPATGNFDANGNTTKFGIPGGLVGNISAGTPIWASTCSGCHGSGKQNRTFTQIKASFAISAMSGIHLSDAQIANLTAYLNRFRP